VQQDGTTAARLEGFVASIADASPRFLGGGMDSLFIQKSADGDYYDDGHGGGKSCSIDDQALTAQLLTLLACSRSKMKMVFEK